MNSNSWSRPASLVAAAVALAISGVSVAQTALVEVVVTGTRKEGVSPTDSLSPVDVISGATIGRQAAFDLTDSLTKVSPSLNTQRYPIADGTAFIRPVSLRNLSPDQTLVLINGSRQHRSALVNLQLAPLGTVNQGSQGVDWSVFPSAAIERVEVLRDGASAQYGSDAIAGVVNVILKDASEGGSLSAQYGEYSESDGERVSVSGNIGLPLSDAGFVNLTGEYSSAQITSRGEARFDIPAIAAIVGSDVIPAHGLGVRWGDPDVEATKFFVNAGYSISDRLELYGNANYMDNKTINGFLYRRPVLPTAADQIAVGSARETLQIDGDGDGLPDPADPLLVASIIAGGGDPADYLTADGAGGYLLRNPIYSLFPGGYNPDFGADITDLGLVFGLRGDLSDTLSWDARVRYGESKADYRLEGSINPSLGRLSPTSFRPGKLTQEESGLNVDFVKTFASSPLNFAFGGELRNETYKIAAGDQASYEAGPGFIFGVGSDGFQGFPLESEGTFKSDSYAGYVDLETDLTDRLSGGVAVRYENFDKFGDTTDGKVSARFAFTDSFAVRATASTGFRAPTPGQVNTLNVTTTANSLGQLIPNGTYPVSSDIALALGSVPLKPEQSESYTLGFVWAPSDRTSVTVDYYHINIDDRLTLFQNAIGPAQIAQLIAAGIDPARANLLNRSNANFFVNGFDSEVEGIDLAISNSFDVAGGDLLVDLRYNYNDQKVSNVTPGTISVSNVYDLENTIPNDRAMLTFDYSTEGMVSGVLRFNYYGDWSNTGGLFSGVGDASDAHSYGSKVLTDLEARFTFGERYMVTIGGENIFDEKADPEGDFVLNLFGVRQSLTSPFGVNGAFWYARASVDF